MGEDEPKVWDDPDLTLSDYRERLSHVIEKTRVMSSPKTWRATPAYLQQAATRDTSVQTCTKRMNGQAHAQQRAGRCCSSCHPLLGIWAHPRQARLEHNKKSAQPDLLLTTLISPQFSPYVSVSHASFGMLFTPNSRTQSPPT